MLLTSLIVALSAEKTARADSVMVTINRVSAEGVGEVLGTVALADTPEGLKLTPNLHGLPPGEHGFHIHENPSCAPAEKDGKMVAAQAAGGHLDPEHTMHHDGPQGKGHRGDLPRLTVGASGEVKTAVVAPKLKLVDVKDHALMIHEGGDNYSDEPKPLGGGGARIACGVVR